MAPIRLLTGEQLLDHPQYNNNLSTVQISLVCLIVLHRPYHQLIHIDIYLLLVSPPPQQN